MGWGNWARTGQLIIWQVKCNLTRRGNEGWNKHMNYHKSTNVIMAIQCRKYHSCRSAERSFNGAQIRPESCYFSCWSQKLCSFFTQPGRRNYIGSLLLSREPSHLWLMKIYACCISGYRSGRFDILLAVLSIGDKRDDRRRVNLLTHDSLHFGLKRKHQLISYDWIEKGKTS